jgi:hypothetical protein
MYTTLNNKLADLLLMALWLFVKDAGNTQKLESYVVQAFVLLRMCLDTSFTTPTLRSQVSSAPFIHLFTFCLEAFCIKRHLNAAKCEHCLVM